eukprot:m.97030 g.97030  ORF g.97030 m.97030 type:complete len:295 (-) comp26943_c0_seq2:49-933(-)
MSSRKRPRKSIEPTPVTPNQDKNLKPPAEGDTRVKKIALKDIAICRLVFIQALSDAVRSDDGTLMFGAFKDHKLERVRLLGIILQISKESFKIDDGTGVATVFRSRHEPLISELQLGQMIEVIGYLDEYRHVHCIACSIQNDPMFEAMRWFQISNLYKQHYNQRNGNVSCAAAKMPTTPPQTMPRVILSHQTEALQDAERKEVDEAMKMAFMPSQSSQDQFNQSSSPRQSGAGSASHLAKEIEDFLQGTPGHSLDDIAAKFVAASVQESEVRETIQRLEEDMSIYKDKGLYFCL